MRPLRVTIAADALRAFERAAAAAWPREAVAVLGGRHDGDAVAVTAVVPIEGAGDATGFTVPPAAFVRTEAALRAAGVTWCGFAHSHPGGAAAPSARDRRELWPRCLQLIVGGAAPDAWTAAAYWFEDGTGTPLPLVLGPRTGTTRPPLPAEVGP